MTAYFLGLAPHRYSNSTGGTMSQVIKGTRPDITPAQIIAVLFGAAAPVASLFGIDLTAAQLSSIEELKWLGLGLLGADATVRIGRNLKDAKVEAAAMAQSPPTPPRVPVEILTSSSSAVPPADLVVQQASFTPQEVEEIDPSDPETDAADADVTDDEGDGR